MAEAPIEVVFAPKFKRIFEPSRYKVFYGGRGGGKSHAVAIALLSIAYSRPVRILCAREFQVSIADSVHRLLCDKIVDLGLSPYFQITKTGITSAVGSEFIFKGLHHNTSEIKSLEGIDYAWVEEAHSVSRDSWELLIPTIRKEGSQIWLTFNPMRPDDETYRRFVLNPPDDALVLKVGWDDNPWFPEVLNRERLYCQRVSPEDYRHIWEGEPRTQTEAQVFKGRYVIEPFETPSEGVRFFHGCDWGFSSDPSALVRCWIQDNRLYVDAEAYGVGVDLDETPQLFDSIPTARKWPIKADAARPETISYMKRKGFNISAAKKWAGSVEDGLAVLKSFEKIVIHPRCKHTAEEFSLYSYKVDKNNGDVLPVLVDAFNHCVAEGTFITTAHGEIPIEQVCVGEKVLTRAGLRRVSWSGKTGENRVLLTVKCKNRLLKCTMEHKLYVIGKGFVEAVFIQPGDPLLIIDGAGMMRVVESEGVVDVNSGRVYDLTVEGQHEFFANGILVHNCIDSLRYALDGYIHGRNGLHISNDLFRRVR